MTVKIGEIKEKSCVKTIDEDNKLKSKNQDAPLEDKYYACYALIYGTACAIWVPISFITTAYNYWMYKLGDSSSNDVNKNYYQKYFFATCGSMQMIIGVIVPLIVYLAKYISINKRLFIIYGTALTVLSFTLAMIKIDTHPWQEIFYYVSLSTVAILTASSCTLYTLLLELTAKFPPKYLGFIEAGGATVGIFSAVIQIFSLEVGASPQISGTIYFCFAVGYIIFSILLYLIITNTSKFYKHTISIVTEAKQNENITFDRIKSIFWKVKIPIIAYTLNICTTMTTHPGLTVLVVSQDAGNGSEWNDHLFTPVVVYLLTAIVSITTRFVTLYFKQMTNQHVLFVMCIMRIALIPLLMLCNAQPRNHLPVIFQEDYYFIIFILIFFVSDCFLNTTLTLLIPRMCEPDEKYLGNVISLSFQNVFLLAVSYVNVVIVNSF